MAVQSQVTSLTLQTIQQWSIADDDAPYVGVARNKTRHGVQEYVHALFSTKTGYDSNYFTALST
jgi:hypothetical protein